MKGGISLVDFIDEVKEELSSRQREASGAFFELEEVTLEVSFGLDLGGKTGAKLVVLDLSGETKASQLHKVSLKLKPLPVKQGRPAAGAGGGGRVGHKHGPLYK